MSSDNEFGLSLTTDMSFVAEPSTIELDPVDKNKIRNRIKRELNDLLTERLTAEELENLTPVPKLNAKTDSFNYNRTKATAEWVSRKGIKADITHVSSDDKEFSDCCANFTREFDGMDIILTVARSQDDGEETSYLTVMLDKEGNAEALVRIYISGIYRGKVLIQGADIARTGKDFDVFFPGYDLSTLDEKESVHERNGLVRELSDELFFG